MKATGIVRRIDNLGRVVIPKEISRTMRIREGDPLHIHTNRDGATPSLLFLFLHFHLHDHLAHGAGGVGDIAGTVDITRVQHHKLTALHRNGLGDTVV